MGAASSATLLAKGATLCIESTCKKNGEERTSTAFVFNIIQCKRVSRGPFTMIRRRENLVDKFTFRTMERGDIEEVKYLHKELFPVQYGQNFFDRLLTDEFWTLVAVSKMQTKVCGIITARFKNDEEDCPDCCGICPPQGYISTIGVLPAYQKQGLL